MYNINILIGGGIMTISELQNEIIRLKKEKDICILAHSYQAREILEVADYTGDSYKLSVDASKAENKNIIMSTSYSMSITYFTTMSMFLAFAVIFSEQVVMLYFMIPLKVKWLGYFDFAYLVYEFIKADDLFARVIIVSSVANFFIYFLINRRRNVRENIENYKRRRDFQKRMKGANITGVYTGGADGGRTNSNQTASGRPEVKKINPFNNNPPAAGRHRCAVCGRTDADNDELEFRYCSKCTGGLEYCMDHLYTHEHKK